MPTAPLDLGLAGGHRAADPDGPRASDIRFEVLYGASDNAASWWDNSRAHQLGYRPAGKAEDYRAHAEAEQAKIGPDPIGDLFQGGTFTSAEFTNVVKRAGPVG